MNDAALAWPSDQQIRFLAENLVEAISPSNVLVVNPGSAKVVIDTGGVSIVRGARAFVRDMSSSPRVPRMVDPDALKPGRDLAKTSGTVVFRSPVPGLCLLVTVLDQAKAGLPAVFVSKEMLGRAAASSARKGYLDGAMLAELFAWLRPGDLIWNYWVNNYLLGQEQPVFDILSWNADTTRMSATLHREFLTVCRASQLITPGAATMMGHARRPVRGPRRQLRGGRRGRSPVPLADADVLHRTGQLVGRLRRPARRARRSAEAEPGRTPGEAASDVPVTGMLDEAAAQRIRSLNQQVLARASAAGAGAVDGYEKALRDMADFETKIPGSSQLDWLQAVARSHTKLVTDLASMYANAIKSGLPG